MLRMNVFISLLLLLFGTAAKASVVILPENAGKLLQRSAEELALHLQLALGKRPEIVSENSPEQQMGKCIYLGNTEMARKSGFDFRNFGEEEWLVQAVSQDRLVIGGGLPRGVLYGVYEFLEHEFNAMWLDEWNIYIEKKQKLNWAPNLKIHGKPSIAWRSIYSNFIDGSNLFKIRNRQNYFHIPLPEKFDSYGIARMYGSPHFCHTFYFYTKDLKKEDQDILSRKDGKPLPSRNSAGPGQICYSNPKTVRHFISRLSSWVEQDRKGKEPWQYPRFYGLKTNDNRNECECEKCRDMVRELGWSGLKMQFVNQVAQAVAGKYPDIYLVTDAYGLHGIPSEKVMPAANVVVEIAFRDSPDRPRNHYRPYSAPENRFSRDLHKKWASRCRIHVWDYWLDCVRAQYPSILLKAMAENIKFYHELGTMCIMGECEAPHVNSLWRMRNWIAYRLMKDVSLDLETEVRRFSQAFYGKAAPQMIAYYHLLEKTMEKVPVNIENLTIDRREDLDPEFFRQAEQLLAAAVKATADDPLRRERVMDERVPVEWAKIERFHVKDDAYIDSFYHNAMRRLKKYTSAYHFRQNRPKLENFYRAAKGHVPALTGFEKQLILGDFTWPKLSLARYNKLVEDKDAMGGWALVPKSGPGKGEPMITMGVYDQKKRSYQMRNAGLPKGAWPVDEKFHWYYLGRCRLSKDSLLYMHPSWTLQMPLSEAVGTPEIFDNDCGIYVSLKVQGPRYVSGSSRPDRYAVDRVVVVRGDTSPQKNLLQFLPEELQGRKIYADLYGNALHMLRKQADSSACCGCAAEVGSLSKSGALSAVFIDPTESQKNSVSYLKPSRDGKYHVYKLFRVRLTDSCRLKVGTGTLPLGGYFAMTAPDREYEVMISVKCNDSGKCFIDRCWLLE